MKITQVDYSLEVVGDEGEGNAWCSASAIFNEEESPEQAFDKLRNGCISKHPSIKKL